MTESPGETGQGTCGGGHALATNSPDACAAPHLPLGATVAAAGRALAAVLAAGRVGRCVQKASEWLNEQPGDNTVATLWLPPQQEVPPGACMHAYDWPNNPPETHHTGQGMVCGLGVGSAGA